MTLQAGEGACGWKHRVCLAVFRGLSHPWGVAQLGSEGSLPSRVGRDARGPQRACQLLVVRCLRSAGNNLAERLREV